MTSAEPQLNKERTVCMFLVLCWTYAAIMDLQVYTFLLFLDDDLHAKF